MKEKTYKIVSIGLAAALVGGIIGMAVITYPKEYPQELSIAENGGMTVVEIEEAKEGSANIALSSVRISEDEYTAYGVSAQAETAYTVTATVAPNNNSPNSGVEWLCRWKDASSEWATGKAVTDYVTAIPAGTTVSQSKTVTVSCLQAFGEQIELVAKSTYNPEVTAICKIDYVQKLKGVTLKFGDIECNLGGETAVKIDLGTNSKANGGLPECTYSSDTVYTVAATNPTISYALEDSGYLLLGNTYGIGSFIGGNYRGFHFFHLTETGEKEDRIHYVSPSNGLYFNYKYFTETLGLRYSSYWQGQFLSMNEEKTVAEFQTAYDYPEDTYTGMYKLFDLTVTLRSGSEILYTGTTTFVMSGYTLTMALSESTLRF